MYLNSENIVDKNNMNIIGTMIFGIINLFLDNIFLIKNKVKINHEKTLKNITFVNS